MLEKDSRAGVKTGYFSTSDSSGVVPSQAVAWCLPWLHVLSLLGGPSSLQARFPLLWMTPASGLREPHLLTALSGNSFLLFGFSFIIYVSQFPLVNSLY